MWSEAMLAFAAAVDRLAAQHAVELPGPQALADTAELMRQVQRLRIVQLQRLADVDARGLHALDGAASTGSWMAAQQLEVDRSEVALARALRSRPLVNAQVLDGSLPLRSARLIDIALGKLARFLDRPDGLLDGQPQQAVLRAVIVDGVGGLVGQAGVGSSDDDRHLEEMSAELTRICFEPTSAIERLEAAFVVLALHLEPAHLRPALAMLIDALLPVQLQDRSDRADADRGLVLVRKPGGSGWLLSRAELNDECGERLWTVLQAELGTDPDNPADTAAAAAATAGRPEEAPAELYDGAGPRTLAQRGHDALNNALGRLLDSGVLGQRGKHVPHIAVTVSLDTLHDLPGALPATGASGQPLPNALVRRWLCDSALTRYVLDLGHRVVESSHTARTLTHHERRRLDVQTGGRCQTAGCPPRPDRPVIPHHIQPWARCHTTSIHDTALLCARCHHDLHLGRATLRLRDGRRINEHGQVDLVPDATGPPSTSPAA